MKWSKKLTDALISLFKQAAQDGYIMKQVLTWLPWAHPNPQPKRHRDRFSRFCRHTDGQTTLLCSNRPPYIPLIVSSAAKPFRVHSDAENEQFCACPFYMSYFADMTKRPSGRK